jgi:hypothetical protein
MVTARLLIPIVIVLLLDLYFFQAIRTVLFDAPQGTRKVIQFSYWIVNIAMYSALVYASLKPELLVYQRYYIFSLFLVLVVPKLIGTVVLFGEDLLRIGEGFYNSLTDSSNGQFLPSRRKFISTVSIISSAIPMSAMVFGMVKTAFDTQVRKRKLILKDLPPSFNGLKVVQISDLHSGSFASVDHFRSAFERIRGLKPDIIFFTGDLVNNEAAEAERFVEEFGNLTAPFGVYSILGNHDYGDYVPWSSAHDKEENLDRLKKVHSDAGWNLLLNGNAVIEKEGEHIAIVGVENWGASRHFPKYGDLDKAVRGVENIPFKLLLSHDPSHWDAQVKAHPHRFQLTLSGHTHGFQFGIEIPGFQWSPVQYVYKQWAGLYSEDDQNLYVNRGLGFIGYMGRIGISPEITLLELYSDIT